MTGLPSDLPIEEIVESNGLYDLRRARDAFGEAWQARDPQGNPIALVRAEVAHSAAKDAREAADLAGKFSHRLVVLEPLIRTILTHFTEKGHPGEPCVRTGWILERLVAEWRAALDSTQPDTPAPGRSGEEKPVVDLMAALRASVDRARASRASRSDSGLPVDGEERK